MCFEIFNTDATDSPPGTAAVYLLVYLADVKTVPVIEYTRFSIGKNVGPLSSPRHLNVLRLIRFSTVFA